MRSAEAHSKCVCCKSHLYSTDGATENKCSVMSGISIKH